MLCCLCRQYISALETVARFGNTTRSDFPLNHGFLGEATQHGRGDGRLKVDESSRDRVGSTSDRQLLRSVVLGGHCEE
jgi:hypothetical protein